MTKYGYIWEKLHVAMLSLISDGSLQHRMQYAVQALHTLTRDGHHWPENMKQEFEDFYEQMTITPGRSENEGSIKATANSMDEEILSEKAKEILSMYDRICRYQAPR